MMLVGIVGDDARNCDDADGIRVGADPTGDGDADADVNGAGGGGDTGS